jgi:hypothetical protein
VVQVVVSFLDVVVYTVWDEALQNSVPSPEHEHFHDSAAVVEWVALVMFLLDPVLRLALRGPNLFFTQKVLIRGQLVTEMDLFSIFDFSAVLVWATLIVLKRLSKRGEEYAQGGLLPRGGEWITNLVLCLRLLRAVKVRTNSIFLRLFVDLCTTQKQRNY